MESSGYEAVIIGLNILIFIVALSISINLMVSVNSLSEVANNIMGQRNDGMNVTIEQKTRKISGQELLYYNSDEYTEKKYNIQVRVGGSNSSLQDYIQSENINTILTSNYTLEYNGELSNKLVYILKKI